MMFDILRYLEQQMCTFVSDFHAVSHVNLRTQHWPRGHCRLLNFPSQAYSYETVTSKAFTGPMQRTSMRTSYLLDASRLPRTWLRCYGFANPTDEATESIRILTIKMTCLTSQKTRRPQVSDKKLFQPARNGSGP